MQARGAGLLTTPVEAVMTTTPRTCTSSLKAIDAMQVIIWLSLPAHFDRPGRDKFRIVCIRIPCWTLWRWKQEPQAHFLSLPAQPVAIRCRMQPAGRRTFLPQATRPGPDIYQDH